MLCRVLGFGSADAERFWELPRCADAEVRLPELPFPVDARLVELPERFEVLP